jgi:predicted signal transduction protein with EAL and GGDEF domain
MPSRYDRQSDARLRTRAKLTRELGQASVEDNFVFYYQPKVAMETGAIIGAGALIRWEHPVFGLQPPDRFIPSWKKSALFSISAHGLCASRYPLHADSTRTVRPR